MAADQHVGLGTTTSGTGAIGPRGRRVYVPVRDVARSRGLVVGDAGSGTVNTGTLLATTLADRGFGVVVVDATGRFADTLADGGALRVGGSAACDLELTDDRIEPVADLALETGAVTVLDRTTYQNATAADVDVAALGRHLISVAKGRAVPLLLVVDRIESTLPVGGPVTDAGRVLQTIAQHGSRRGLGVCGISRRPGAVTETFVRGTDWRLWHRVTGDDGATATSRWLDTTYADAVARLADREAFVDTDWFAGVRRVAIDPVTPSPASPQDDGPTVREKGRAALDTALPDPSPPQQAQDTPSPAQPGAADGEPAADAGGSEGVAAFGAFMADGAEGTADASDDAAAVADVGSTSDDGSSGPERSPTDSPGGTTPPTRSMGDQVATFERGAEAGVLDPWDPTEATTDRPSIVSRIETALASLDERALAILDDYRSRGPERPVDVYRRVTATADRVAAYTTNRQLRRAGLIEHVGRGHYDYCLPAAIASAADARRPRVHARHLEQEYLGG